MLLKYLTVTFLLSASIVISQAHADDLQEEIRNATNVNEAVSIIVNEVKDQGYEVPLVVDHAAAAASVGLELRPTKVIFVTPPTRLEKRILKRSTTIGIDLPIKFLVFEDSDGKIQLRYNPTGYLIDRHHVHTHDRLLERLTNGSEQFGDIENGLITVPSNQSINATADALKAAISANPAFRIPLTMEYKNRAILIVFGNPAAGTPLMQATQDIGLDLPQKFLVWQDQYGQVQITYNDPFFFAKRHNVQNQGSRLSAIAGALANFASFGANN